MNKFYLCVIFIVLHTDMCINIIVVQEKGPKLVIDNDAGGDDAMAIFLAVLNEKYNDGPKLVALTTGNGNTNEDNVCRNNQRILKAAKRQDIPIFRGSKSSLLVTPATNAYYGIDGLGDVGDNVTDLVPPQENSAVFALIELSKKYAGELTVITIGTLTNVALAIRLDPEFLNRIGHLYVGAGHVHGLANPDAEFNALMDVEAYQIVMQAATPEKVTVVPYSQVQSSLNFTMTWRQEVLGAIDCDIVRAQNQFESVALGKNEFWQSLDPAVVALAVRPDLVREYRFSRHAIVTCGERRGITEHSFVPKEDANVRVMYEAKNAEYGQFLLDVFNADAKQSNGNS